MLTLTHAPPQVQPTEACRPPAGTAIDAVCYLTNGAVDMPFRWSGRRWISTYIRNRSHPPSDLARRGWRFARLAAPAPKETT